MAKTGVSPEASIFAQGRLNGGVLTQGHMPVAPETFAAGKECELAAVVHDAVPELVDGGVAVKEAADCVGLLLAEILQDLDGSLVDGEVEFDFGVADGSNNALHSFISSSIFGFGFDALDLGFDAGVLDCDGLDGAAHPVGEAAAGQVDCPLPS